jgi:hypothetical protein
MTSLKQIEANRRNALKSTGPRTGDGKQRASRNAVRHGLTAETVVELLEDPEDYKAFEQAVAADYDAESAVERELILRLASLLWRLRRATSIETGLLSIEDEIVRERGQSQPTSTDGALTALFPLRRQTTNDQSDGAWSDRGWSRHAVDTEPGAVVDVRSESRVPTVESDVARRFLRVANLDDGVFERLGRYEMMLWRQVRQTLFTLEGMRWRSSSPRYPSPHFWRRRTEAPSLKVRTHDQ